MKLNIKKGLLHILCLMAILAFHSCSHEWFDGDKRCLNPAVEEARAYFEENATDLSMPQLLIPPETKTDDIFSGGNLVPAWDKFISAENDRFTTLEIPLSRDFAMRAAIFYPQDGKHRFVSENVRVQSNLVIRKSKKSGNFNYFVATIIGSSAPPAERNNNPWTYLGSRKGFNGYVIISNVEGDILETFYYRNGNRFFVKLKSHEKRGSVDTNIFGFIVGQSMPLTKGGSYETGESIELCPFCYKVLVDYMCDCPNWLENVTVTGEYVYCDKCGMLKGHCVCGNNPCPLCGKEPCECSGQEYNCEYCGSPYCNGRCQGESDNRGGGDNTPTPDPEEPPNPIDTVGYHVSNIIPCVKYDSEETMAAVEPTLSLLAIGGNSSKIMEYIRSRNIPVIFESNPTQFTAYDTRAGVGKTSGKLKYVRITFYENATFRLGEILHEFTHIWYKIMYPSVKLDLNMNSEAISTIAEYLCFIDYPELTDQFVEYGKMKTEIMPFWNNSCAETFERVRQFIIERSRRYYENFILDEMTFYKQVDDFKALFK